jgi:hypothetical protein
MPRISYSAATTGADGRLNRIDAARYLGLTSKCLAEWKRMGKGPPSHKIGGMCFYYTNDLRAFVRESAGRGN